MTSHTREASHKKKIVFHREGDRGGERDLTHTRGTGGLSLRLDIALRSTGARTRHICRHFAIQHAQIGLQGEDRSLGDGKDVADGGSFGQRGL